MKNLLHALALGGLFLAACHTGDVNPLEQQPKFQAYEENDFFADGRAMRPLVEGTVPRERLLVNHPPEITAALVTQGKEKFEQICSVCHGLDGQGNTEVTRKMSLKRSPNLHEERYRVLTNEHIFNVMTYGYGYMPRYTTQLSDRDRWAVVSYLRALQSSRTAKVSDLPDDLKQQLEKSK